MPERLQHNCSEEWYSKQPINYTFNKTKGLLLKAANKLYLRQTKGLLRSNKPAFRNVCEAFPREENRDSIRKVKDSAIRR